MAKNKKRNRNIIRKETRRAVIAHEACHSRSNFIGLETEQAEINNKTVWASKTRLPDWIRVQKPTSISSAKFEANLAEHLANWVEAGDTETVNSTKEAQEKEATKLALLLLGLSTLAFPPFNKLYLDASPKTEEIQEPSKNLLFIVGMFYSAKEREAVRGDLEENFRKDAKRFGRRKAHLYIIRDLLVSIYPTTKRALVKLLKLATFYAILKKIIS